MVAARLDDLGAPYTWFNQRQFASMSMAYSVTDGGVDGDLRIGSDTYRLSNFSGVYLRLMDDQRVPELSDDSNESPRRKRSRALSDTLIRWCEIAEARVVNRMGPQSSNFSKPYQAQLIARVGFRVPETLVTNDPELARSFYRQHGRVVFKSISGNRSIVRLLADADLARLDTIRWCPVQFQAFVEGRDVRVHTVGDEVFATGVTSDASDYRYARQQVDDDARLEPIEVSEELAAGCVTLARSLGLDFAGIDLRIGPGGQVHCFEVNPSPAYSYYELNTGQPISMSVARYLVGGQPSSDWTAARATARLR